MRKLLLVTLITIGTIFTADAQIIADNAIGLRLGGGDGYGGEISYQRALNKPNNRIEVDLGWRTDDDFDSFRIVGLYQWVWKLEKNFNWYAGLGVGGGIVDADEFVPEEDGAFGLVAGNIGIEYNFDLPWMISLDFRPEVSFGDDEVKNDFNPDVALGIRYQF